MKIYVTAKWDVTFLAVSPVKNWKPGCRRNIFGLSEECNIALLGTEDRWSSGKQATLRERNTVPREQLNKPLVLGV